MSDQYDIKDKLEMLESTTAALLKLDELGYGDMYIQRCTHDGCFNFMAGSGIGNFNLDNRVYDIKFLSFVSDCDTCSKYTCGHHMSENDYTCVKCYKH